MGGSCGREVGVAVGVAGFTGEAELGSHSNEEHPVAEDASAPLLLMGRSCLARRKS